MTMATIPCNAMAMYGTRVTGWVREVDPSKKRLSLSLREIAVSDPWESAQQKYPVGKVIEGVVDHGAAPGIFVQIVVFGSTGPIDRYSAMPSMNQSGRRSAPFCPAGEPGLVVMSN